MKCFGNKSECFVKNWKLIYWTSQNVSEHFWKHLNVPEQFWNFPKTNLNISEQSWKFSRPFLKHSQNKSECFGINWKFRNIMKIGQSTKQVRMFRNIFKKCHNIPEQIFENVFVTNLKYSRLWTFNIIFEDLNVLEEFLELFGCRFLGNTLKYFQTKLKCFKLYEHSKMLKSAKHVLGTFWLPFLRNTLICSQTILIVLWTFFRAFLV